MALDQSALLALLAELKLTNVTDRIRTVTETLYHELIDAAAMQRQLSDAEILTVASRTTPTSSNAIPRL
ncbi:hypothetical protein E3O25_05590 [Cryobacterium sp. TMT1-3]|nr:hypothetical protein E3O25_05590 [Cryobacterium sp. TMT1-3]